jgi:hypothetical protein
MPSREIEDFIARWSAASPSERANAQFFLVELCDLLGVPRPDPKPGSGYAFEFPVTELSLAKTLSDEAGQGRRVFRAGVVQSSNGEPSGEGAERMFASRIESTRSTPPVEPEYSIRGWQQS